MMQPIEKDGCEIFLVEESDVSHEKLEDWYKTIRKSLERLPVGGLIIFNLGKCSVLGPSVLMGLVKKLQEGAKRRKQGILKGRHFIVLDPSEDVELLLSLLLEKAHWSLIVAFSKAKAGSKSSQKVLNLPEFLSHPLKFIENREGTTARELERHLDKEYKTPARECLRQLFRRGLVVREGTGASEGQPHFIYRAVKLPEMLQ